MSTEEWVIDDEIVERTERETSVIADMKRLVERLAENPELELPYSISPGSYSVSVQWYPSTVEKAADLVRALGGKWDKNDPTKSDHDGNYLIMTQKATATMNFTVTISRGKVCTPKVVGTERKKVTKYVAVEVDETVDIIEYDCGSLYSAAEAERIAKLESGAQ